MVVAPAAADDALEAAEETEEMGMDVRPVAALAAEPVNPVVTVRIKRIALAPAFSLSLIN